MSSGVQKRTLAERTTDLCEGSRGPGCGPPPSRFESTFEKTCAKPVGGSHEPSHLGRVGVEPTVAKWRRGYSPVVPVDHPALLR